MPKAVKAIAKEIIRLKKKRKHGTRKLTHPIFSYTLLPKRKRLAKKVVEKLENENDQYMIARLLDVITQLDRGKSLKSGSIVPSPENLARRNSKKEILESKKLRENRIIQITNRALLRRKRIEAKREEELKRKKYRVHPADPNHKYVPRYKKARHRISKKRFLNCVDVPLLLDVLNDNKELLESPLWNEKVHLQNISVEKAQQLRDHLYQFDVIVESLKQGLFDLPGCDDLPISRVRQKKRTPSQIEADEQLYKKMRRRHSSSHSRSRLQRRWSFPPYEEEEESFQHTAATRKESPPPSIMHYLKNWRNCFRPSPKALTKVQEDVPQSDRELIKTERSKQSVSVSITQEMNDTRASSIAPPLPSSSLRKSRRTLPPVKGQKSVIPADNNLKNLAVEASKNEPKSTPFADLLTITVPTGVANQKKFIRALVDRKGKNKFNRKYKKAEAAEKLRQQEDEVQQRRERVEKLDPFQRLHPDEVGSDILSHKSSTTTASYASWRRQREGRNRGSKKQDVLAHNVDTTLSWRIVLLLLVLYEIASFVKSQLDTIYYWIFTTHLLRENIWLFEPALFPKAEYHVLVHLQRWTHLIVSGISVSIIKRENECVSLLFASTLVCDTILNIGTSTHDYVFLPDPIGWISVVLSCYHVAWKVFTICLFIGYHYYSASYIKKAREFSLRKTALHNHEIRVKGTKGIQKRRMAWSWMTRHARNTNLRHLKKVYPDIKDGNFPADKLAKQIRFNEAKELRFYTQTYHFNIGFPYNKLNDMKRYVFEKLEKSDYTDNDERDELETKKKKNFSKLAKKALTLKQWLDWKAAHHGPKTKGTGMATELKADPAASAP